MNFSATNLTYVNDGSSATNDSFAFQISDGSATASGLVTVTILTNVVPFALSQAVETYSNTPVALTLYGSDEFQEPVNYTVDSAPQHGALSGAAPNLVYTPAAGFTGTDSFTFKVSNAFADSADATVDLTVRGILGAAVTSSADSGPGTLRAALDLANADTFNLWRITLGAGPVLLSSIGDNGFGPSALVVSNRLVVDGGVPAVTIAADPGAPAMRLIRVAPGAQLTLLNLTLTNGRAVGPMGGNGEGGGGGGAGLGGALFKRGPVDDLERGAGAEQGHRRRRRVLRHRRAA